MCTLHLSFHKLSCLCLDLVVMNDISICILGPCLSVLNCRLFTPLFLNVNVFEPYYELLELMLLRD